MTRSIARAALLACVLALTAVVAPSAQASVLPTVSCSGSTQTTVSATGVTTTGTATCNGVATLKQTTTMTVAGLTSSVSQLIPALPNQSVPISATVSAAGVSAACSSLVQVGTGASIATSCSN